MVLHFALYSHQIKLGDFTEVNSDACLTALIVQLMLWLHLIMMYTPAMCKHCSNDHVCQLSNLVAYIVVHVCALLEYFIIPWFHRVKEKLDEGKKLMIICACVY